MNKPLIINSPSLQTLRQKYAYAALTLLFWIVWFYLWLPLVSFLAWMFGIEIFYEHMVVLDGLAGLLELTGWYMLTIALTGVTLISWSSYNQIRFSKNNKRTHRKTLLSQEQADFFAIEPGIITACQHSKSISIAYDDSGNIKAIETAPPYSY